MLNSESAKPIDYRCKMTPSGLTNRNGVETENGEYSCNMFSYCNNGQFIISKCTPGQYFDLEKGQ